MWSVSSIIQGIQSFMASTELTTGGLQTTESEQKKFATASMEYNKKMFPTLFSGDIENALLIADKARIESEKTHQTKSSSTMATRINRIKLNSEKEETNKLETTGNEVKEDHEEEVDDMKATELSQEEIEKRRKKNAKKRAKQKLKKTATSESVVKEQTEG